MQADRTARHRNQALLRDLIVGHGDEVAVFSSHDPIELQRRHERNEQSVTNPG